MKVGDPEEIEIEDLSLPRAMKNSQVKHEVLVRFASVSDRDAVISQAANLKDAPMAAGVRLDIPDHLQSDFKALIQYGNDARDHFKENVKRSVRFFEENASLILHLCLPSSGKWIKVTPNEAREVARHKRLRAEKSLRAALSGSMGAGSKISMTMDAEAAEKAWLDLLRGEMLQPCLRGLLGERGTRHQITQKFFRWGGNERFVFFIFISVSDIAGIFFHAPF